MATKIRKRDGAVADFDKEKIVNAVFKAAQSVGGSDKAEAERVADKVIQYIKEKFAETYTPTVEEVQDLVEKALIETGHASATLEAFRGGSGCRGRGVLATFDRAHSRESGAG